MPKLFPCRQNRREAAKSITLLCLDLLPRNVWRRSYLLVLGRVIKIAHERLTLLMFIGAEGIEPPMAFVYEQVCGVCSLCCAMPIAP